VNCRICNHISTPVFKKSILNRYDVQYFCCPNCFFLQTEDPFWLNEAYLSPFTKTDTGLLARPLRISRVLENSILKHFIPESQFLDFGGGNGILVRLMRDLGFDFYRSDKFAENIYSIYFDISDIPIENRTFELVTAIEVVEHLPNPLITFAELFSFSESLFFSTFLQPARKTDIENWWYLSPFHGQHISFYHRKTLEYIASKFNKNLYSDGKELHIMTSKNLQDVNFGSEELIFETGPYKLKNRAISMLNKVYNKIFKPIAKVKRESLTMKDLEKAVSIVMKDDN
jgi:hypothetical protein